MGSEKKQKKISLKRPTITATVEDGKITYSFKKAPTEYTIGQEETPQTHYPKKQEHSSQPQYTPQKTNLQNYSEPILQETTNRYTPTKETPLIPSPSQLEKSLSHETSPTKKVPEEYFVASRWVPGYERKEILKRNKGDYLKAKSDVERLTELRKRKETEEGIKEQEKKQQTYSENKKAPPLDKHPLSRKKSLDKTYTPKSTIESQEIAEGTRKIPKLEPSIPPTKEKKKRKANGGGIMTPEEKASMSPEEYRREYQRRYYRAHEEKAKEYQRQYNLTHKKKSGGGRGRISFQAEREVIRETFNHHDLQEAPPEKFARMVNQIAKSDRLFTIALGKEKEESKKESSLEATIRSRQRRFAESKR